MPGALVTREEYRSLDIPQRLELMLGATLSDIECLLAYPIDKALKERDSIILTAKLSTHRAVLHTCMKLGIERSRAMRDQDKVIDRLSAGLRARLKK